MNGAKEKQTETGEAMDQRDELRRSPMMAHLLDALEAGTDIGHYGRLTFCMVARHFLPDDEMVRLLRDQPDQDEEKVRVMLLQVRERDYNPPKRERILEWQERQEFAICPDASDPTSCNVYRELEFPERVYGHIQEYYEEREEAREAAA